MHFTYKSHENDDSYRNNNNLPKRVKTVVVEHSYGKFREMGLSAIKRIVPSPKHSHTQKRFLLEAKEKGKRIIAGETVNLASYIMLNVRGALEEIRFKNYSKVHNN